MNILCDSQTSIIWLLGGFRRLAKRDKKYEIFNSEIYCLHLKPGYYNVKLEGDTPD